MSFFCTSHIVIIIITIVIREPPSVTCCRQNIEMRQLDGKYENQVVAVFGLGKTGLSTIQAFGQSNVSKTYAWDDNQQRVTNAKTICPPGTIFTPPQEWNWRELKTLILSPGVPFSYPKPHEVVQLAKKSNCEIKSDIDLFLEMKTDQQKVIAVTGTNGKSTTTSLIGHILQLAGKKVSVGGNLGNPVLNLDNDSDIYVIELSSFQIELMNEFDVDVGVLLNITPDHLDRHGNMENYVEIKKKLIDRSKVAVIGCDNRITARIFDQFAGNKISVLASTSPFSNSNINQGEAKINVISNAENIAAACAVCEILGIDGNVVVNGIKSFAGLKHRNEPLGRVSNVFFVNDSKATNAESTQKAISSYKRIHWIVGGRSKEGGIESLREYFSNIEKAYLIGESTEAFANTLNEGGVNYVKCGDLETAFRMAFEEASKNSEEDQATVLLSPSCASYDQWRNFEERGEAFCRMFERLKSR
ncbi:UDP-N-acetylmuramoylalanine--D-glutamate ligase-like [Planococcus citri]|uniref:UDP-N-acetylmuramoyl-L-alanine:D-glutamate ligase n=1 Tax=Planococcus citri TaxID=170843 RepID=S5NFD3_9HEMI|nr:UDP-N-acetylmuramoyl-L-alanine:D-glutamate ligase [Planococcus citri]